MRAAGCEIVVGVKDIAVIGITEIVRHLPRIYSRFRNLVREIERRHPAVGVVIDSPAFNLRVARALHRRKIPAIYYVAPQFWAWRQWRARILRKYISKALVIFPFEVEFYRRWGVNAEFVGHPLADLATPAMSREELAQKHDLNSAKMWITLMPGSRRKEVQMNLPAMITAAKQLGNGYEFLLPVAHTLDNQFLRELIGDSHGVVLVPDSLAALTHSRAAVVASGTATVEAALMRTPFVMVYRVSPLTYFLGRPLVKVPRFAMVNLIAGKEVVPELVQSDFTVENIVSRLGPLLAETESRSRMLAEFGEVRTKLKGGLSEGGDSAPERAADAVLNAIS